MLVFVQDASKSIGIRCAVGAVTAARWVSRAFDAEPRTLARVLRRFTRFGSRKSHRIGDLEPGYPATAACVVGGVTYRQLDYWARTGLLVPSLRDGAGPINPGLYSFRDLVALKVIKRLLDAGVSLQNIRSAIDTLRSWGKADLASVTLISDGTTIYECRSVVDLLQGGQGVFGIAIGGAFKEVEGSLARQSIGAQGNGGRGTRGNAVS